MLQEGDEPSAAVFGSAAIDSDDVEAREIVKGLNAVNIYDHARALVDAGEGEKALAWVEDSLAYALSHGNDQRRCDSLGVLAMVLGELGHQEEALSKHEQAAALADELSMTTDIADNTLDESVLARTDPDVRTVAQAMATELSYMRGSLVLLPSRDANTD